MPTLAPKLPWQHAFAGGYPRRGGQPLPTDADAIDYLNRVAAADGGVSVEVGIAQAIDAFVRGCKKDGIWDALKASCILCGARTIAGALVPLAGTAPTALGGWSSGDYNRETGLKGDGVGKYLDTNRANNADPQDDNHNALYYSYVNAAEGKLEIGAGGSGVGANNFQQASSSLFIRNRSALSVRVGSTGHTGFGGMSRSSAGQISYRINAATGTTALSSEPASADNVYVFARNNGSGGIEGKSDARLAFYSIGTAVDLAALDARVTTLVSQIAAAIP